MPKTRVFVQVASVYGKPFLKLQNPPGDPVLVGRHVQEQTITALAMVAGASEVTFVKTRPVWEKKGKAELELDANTLVELLTRKQWVSYCSERQC
jgi:hypothetical protein